MSCECDDWLARQAAGLPGRCAKHAAMMRAIREAYQNPAAARGLDQRIYLASDGFGEATNPDEVEWDWSGIRDSSPAGVEAMYHEVQRG